MQNYNITIKEILEHLQSKNFQESIIEECKEKRYQYSKTDIYDYAYNQISNEIYSLIDNNRKNIYCSKVYNKNSSNRYIDIHYIDDTSRKHIFLTTISYKISCTKKIEWKISELVFLFSWYEEGSITKSIQQLIDNAIMDIERQKEDNINIHLPQHIEDSRNLFKKIIEKMENGEDISFSDEYKLKNVIYKYNKFKNNTNINGIS